MKDRIPLFAVAATVAALMLLWWTRYDVEPAGEALAFKLDRLTGRVTFIRGMEEYAVRPAER